ncbi:ABC transporter ATP-binding protein [Candidatus Riflebacteria bacterium]
MIELKKIHQKFEKDGSLMSILDEINLDIMDGEFTCVLGPSGCGKTTLLNIIGGFVPPYSGNFLLDGQPCSYPDRHRGIVFQDYSLFRWLTVEENVAMGLELEEIHFLTKFINPFFYQKKQKFINKAREYLETVGLENAITKYPFELSGGMKQRVAIAQALIMQPRVLLMDEPFGALDPLTRDELQRVIKEIHRKEKVTIFFITHDMDEALHIATRIILLSHHSNTDSQGKSKGARVVLDKKIDRNKITAEELEKMKGEILSHF